MTFTEASMILRSPNRYSATELEEAAKITLLRTLAHPKNKDVLAARAYLSLKEQIR